jgi:hypothetical protein
MTGPDPDRPPAGPAAGGDGGDGGDREGAPTAATTPIDVDDPAALSLEQLRAVRQTLQAEDDAVSFTRRVAQARLDLVSAEAERRLADTTGPASENLREILSRQLTGGDPRPPRPTEDLSDHPVAVELEELCRTHGFGRLDELDDDELVVLRDRIAEFEARVSADRQARYGRLDALSAELVARYRDGRADVDAILAD